MLKNLTFNAVVKKVQKAIDSCENENYLEVSEKYCKRLIKNYCENRIKKENPFCEEINLNTNVNFNRLMDYLTCKVTQKRIEFEKQTCF